jgi:21S rRNA (GM2251-2'-O)-methyltransferase
VTGLGLVQQDKGSFTLDLDHQTTEEEVVNGTHADISYSSQGRRFPLVLMLDGILDTGNLGAIMRSAYFLGADAVVLSTHSAPLGAVALKAAAGAIENLPIVTVRQTGTFMSSSQERGWKFYAAVAPPAHLKDATAAQQAAHKHFTTTTLNGPLIDHPCVLMLGNEGTGLKRDLQRQADYSLSIEGKRSEPGGVDSLNVSVAAALLCDAFLNDAKSRSTTSTADLF